jgi:hypothetical protein
VRDVTLEHHRSLLSRIEPELRACGLRKKGWGFWKRTDDGHGFAGLFARPKLVRGSKRLEFSAITMGGWADLHELFRPTLLTKGPFTVGHSHAQFDHDIVDPKGAGFAATLWTIWPSSDVEALRAKIMPRLIAETLPAVEIMLDRARLADCLEREVVDGRVYIRARNYSLTQRAIQVLRGLSVGAYS